MRRMFAAGAVIALTATLLGAAAAPVPEDTTDPVRAAEYWLDQYGIREAWQTTRGAGVKIAVIDTGVAKGPVEFAGVVGGTDVSGSGSADGRTPVGTADGPHGSLVASLAASRGTGEGGGMIGVAPEAEVLSVSIGFGANAIVPFTEQIVRAIRWSVDNGADIINMSLTTNTLEWDPSWDAAFQYAYDNDVVVIAAAGNRGSGTSRVGAPSTIPGVLTVGGVDPAGFASEEASTQGITIGVVAPSEQLIGVSPDGALVSWRGTSGAAPIVSGIAALVRAAHPDLDANNVIERLIETAQPPPDAAARPELYGNGLVDAAAAVTADVPTVSANPMGDLAEWVRVNRRADAEPVAEPTVGPIEIEALPEADQPVPAGSPLLPTRETLLYGSLPLAAGTVAAIMMVLGLTAAARLLRSARGSRTPSHPST